MTENEQKQQLSVAYVHAVAARAGYACQVTPVDDDSVDVMIAARGWIHQNAVLRSPRIEVQLKATATDVFKKDHLVFKLPVKNYEDLRQESALPRLLVVLVLPKNTGDWLDVNEQQMTLRRCAYWKSLNNLPPTKNKKSVSIQIPRSNLFSADQLQNLMRKAATRNSL